MKWVFTSDRAMRISYTKETRPFGFCEWRMLKACGEVEFRLPVEYVWRKKRKKESWSFFRVSFFNVDLDWIIDYLRVSIMVGKERDGSQVVCWSIQFGSDKRMRRFQYVGFLRTVKMDLPLGNCSKAFYVTFDCFGGSVSMSVIPLSLWWIILLPITCCWFLMHHACCSVSQGAFLVWDSFVSKRIKEEYLVFIRRQPCLTDATCLTSRLPIPDHYSQCQLVA